MLMKFHTDEPRSTAPMTLIAKLSRPAIDVAIAGLVGHAETLAA
jgi:hypothetical protein